MRRMIIRRRWGFNSEGKKISTVWRTIWRSRICLVVSADHRGWEAHDSFYAAWKCELLMLFEFCCFERIVTVVCALLYIKYMLIFIYEISTACFCILNAYSLLCLLVIICSVFLFVTDCQILVKFTDI